MEAFGLPMTFGKQAKKGPSNLQARVETTKREISRSPSPPTKSEAEPARPVAGPSRPSFTVDDEEAIGPAPPMKGASNGHAPVDDDDIGPMPPPPVPKRKANSPAPQSDESEDDDDPPEDDDEEDDADRTPVTHEIILKDHTKVVSAIAVDPSGARIASGSHDYDTKLWDFGGMDARLKPFKSFEANGNYHVHDLSYSPDGQQLLVVSGTTIPKVFNRDAEEESAIEFNKGDVYLRDMKNTSGHTAEINAGSWHPTDKATFLTCSNDSTLRVWDVANKRKQKQVIVVKSKERGARTRVTSCAWSTDGKMVAGACLDGTLNVWSMSSNFARPNMSNEAAHAKNTDITGVVFAQDGHRLASRGGDDTVKLWDLRSMRKPLATRTDLPNLYSETNLIFSPDQTSILTGIAAPKGSRGSLVFLDAHDLSETRRTPLGEGSVVKVLWHSRINQILATLSTGAIHVLYSPRSSIHGALLPLAKTRRTTARDASYSSADTKPVIFTPDALPMFADQNHRESLHQREKRSKRLRPEEPVSGRGKGGRLGASLTQGFVQTIFPDKLNHEDPREALLKYATKRDEKEE